MEEIYIYTLSDPATNIIKYVGKSKNPKNRLQRHMSNDSLNQSRTSKNKWLLYLKNNNLMPIINIIDIGNHENINDLEKYWISKLKNDGIKLKNETIGGDGFDWSGRKHKIESIEKMKMNHPFRRSVIQFNISGQIINTFNSTYEAAEKTGFYRGHISKSCHGKYLYINNKYYFRFADNLFEQRDKIKHTEKKLYKISEEGNLEYTYKSIKEACNTKLFSRTSIKRHLDKRTLYKGYYWQTYF